MAITYVRLTGTIYHPITGAVIDSGTIAVRGSSRFSDPSDNKVYEPVRTVLQVVGGQILDPQDSSVGARLPASVDATHDPASWTYELIFKCGGYRVTRTIELDAAQPGGTIDLADIADAVADSGTTTYATAAQLSAHTSATTSVHGTADTATLVTAAGPIADDSFVRGLGGGRGVEGRTPAQVRGDLSLGGAAQLDVGSSAGTVAAGDAPAAAVTAHVGASDPHGDRAYADTGLAGKASTSHQHSAADITSGTLTVQRGGTGLATVTADSYVKGNGTSALVPRTPSQVRTDIAALAAPTNPSVASVVTVATDGTVGTAPRSQLRALGRRRVGFIGDSITAGVSSYQPPGSTGNVEDASAPATWAMLQSSRGSWDLAINAGVGGQTSTQILARITDITSSPCDIGVILSATWNDIGTGLTVAQSVANYTSMIAALLAADILPVLCTPTPDGTSGTSTARKDGAERRRREIIKLGQVYGIPVIDLFTPIVDVTTGSIAAAYLGGSSDVHPAVTGQKVLGQAITDVLDRLCLGSTPIGIPYAGATDDLLAGVGYFVTDTNADGISDGWFADGSAGVCSVFTDPVLGKMQRVTTTASSRQIFRSSIGSMALVAGHVIELAGYISKNGTSQAQVVLNTASGARRVTIAGTSPDITRSFFRCRWVVPAAPATSFVLLAGSGTGTCDFGRITIRDLTALGIE